MKWGQKYGPEYVNRLYGMVRAHLQGDFCFVCLTDDASGLNPAIRVHPIPALNLPAGIPERGWTKLTTFSPDLVHKYGLRGTALFLDIDIVIVGPLDAFFTHPGAFCIIHDYKRPWRITGNSSVYRFQLGAHTDVLQHFQAEHASIRQRHRNEQAYLSEFIHAQGQLSYWPADWCPSFKYHCIPAWPSNYWRPPYIPAQARIIIFHGECNPPDALAGRRNRFLRYIKPTPWIAEHWQNQG